MITVSISPIAFTIGSMSVRWYGIMVALAVLVLVLWMLWEVKKGAKLSYETIITAALVSIPSGIIFARFLHVIDLWDYYVANPGEIIGFSGLAIFGSILGAALGVWICSRFLHYRFGYLADLLAPGIILAQAIGRVGCTINGCCYGKATSLPWGFVYTHPQSYAPLGVAVHPTQVYEILFLVALFVFIFKFRKRFKPDGSLFLVYLGFYSVWRIGIDFIRDGTSFLFGLHQAQVVGIIVLLIVIPLLVLRTRWVKAESKA